MSRIKFVAVSTSAFALVCAPALAQDNGGVVTPVPPQASAANNIEEVIVTGTFVPDEKRDTSEIANVLDLADMSLLGDGDIGNMLSRVTGLSLVGGKFVYVRGLGDRYSSTLLNRSRISSPVPFQKTVPLDFIPSSLAESLLVQKTYSSQYPGDFSGGVVDIRSKSTPDEDFYSFSFGLGGNSESTGGAGLYGASGGDDDNFGYDDGTRLVPDNIRDLGSAQFQQADDTTNAVYGASFFNNWDVRERDELKPDYSGEAEFGRRIELGSNLVLGVIGAAKYSNEWRHRESDFRRYEFGTAGSSTQTTQYNEDLTTQNIGLSGFLSVGLEYGANTSFTYTGVALRQTENVVEQRRGLTDESDFRSGTFVENYRIQWTENQIISHQLSGEHFFPQSELTATWRVGSGSASRHAPDTRTYTYFQDTATIGNVTDTFDFVLDPTNQAAGDLRSVVRGPTRLYSELQDDIGEVGLDLEMPIYHGDVEVIYTAGVDRYKRSRVTEDRTFRFGVAQGVADTVRIQTPSQLFGTANWQNELLVVDDFSVQAANSSGIFPFAEAEEEVIGYYLGANAQLTSRLRTQLGLRRETATLRADAYGGNTVQGDEENGNFVDNDYADLLPAASLTWEFVDNMQLRAAWSKTVNRPSLLEITGSTLLNPENQEFYRGNVFLEPADLENYDIRWEWYFGAANFMSVGVFQKDFDNPIEAGKVGAQNDIFTYFNAESAELEGVELEVRMDTPLAEWFPSLPDWTNYLSVSANLSVIDSEVTLIGSGERSSDVRLTGGRLIAAFGENKNTRSITGQSDVLANLLFSYQDFSTGIISTLAINHTGERIALVGEGSAPDIIEEPRTEVDLLLRYEFNYRDSDLELEFKVGNLLDEKFTFTQGGNTYEEYSNGINYSLGVKSTFR